MFSGSYDSDEDMADQGEDADFMIKEEKDYEESENVWKK